LRNVLRARKAARMGKMSRVKGAAFERLYARLLQHAKLSAKRGIGQTRAAGEVADVDVAGWWHELKHGVAPSWRAALEQAKAALRDRAKHGVLELPRAPVVITRDNRGPIVVHVELEHWLPLFILWERADEEQRRVAREDANAAIAFITKAKSPRKS
jgi:hypothetical protein